MAGTGSCSHNPKTSVKQAASGGVFSEELFRDFIKYSPYAAAIFDRNMVYLACSDMHLSDMGLSEDHVIGKNHYEVIPDLPQRFRDAHQQALQGSVVKNDIDKFTMPDGTIRYASWECRPWYDSEGEIGGMILYGENITERTRILQEAKDQAERDKNQLEAVLSHMESGVAAYDMEGNVIHANPALAVILGYKDRNELLPDVVNFTRFFGLYSYPERKEIPSDEWPMKRLYSGETVDNEKIIIRRLGTGRERIVECYGIPIRNAQGEAELVLLMLTDITDRQLAEEELRKTKEFAEQEQAKWLAVLDHISNGVSVYDASATRVYANETSSVNYEFNEKNERCVSWGSIANNYEVQTYPGRRYLQSDDWPTLRVLRGDHLDGETFYIRRLDKKIGRIVKIFGTPIYNVQGDVVLAVLVSHDITGEVEREQQDKRIQARLVQTQRLESLGVLAGGIAHDFNNLLMGILGYAEIALMKLSLTSPVTKYLDQIKTTSLRAAELCTQLLAYSGQGKIEEKEFSISTLVREMTQMLHTSTAKNCMLQLDIEEHQPLMVGDSSQIQQILMDFVINASEAIGDREGRINISTGSQQCSQEFFSDDFVVNPTNPGLYVTLEVADNGPGMNKETLGRIFEPFFTTKFTGRGLGLSAALGIIRSHGGGLRVASEPGLGTTFTVFFPAIHRGVQDGTVDFAEAEEQRGPFVGRVLLIDDEEVVLEVCSNQLEALGLEVLIARDGLEGVEAYRKKQAEIDLVILDLTMPKMGGEETFRILRGLNPAVKIVLASGYAEEDVTARFAGEKISGYLRKPYTLDQLSSTLSGLLPQEG